MMKKYLNTVKYALMFLLMISSVNAFAADERLIKANMFYSESMFQEAIDAYEEILKTRVESSELYYNLGNSYYRNGFLPSAILNYERALLLAPHDRDIRYNLELAYGQTADKIESVGEFFISRWLSLLRSSSDSDTWAITSIALFICFLVAIFFFFFSRVTIIRKISFFAAILLIAVSLVSLTFSYNQKNRLVKRDRAIVFSPSVTVKSSPDISGTEIFVVHEGTHVKILQTLGEWYEVEINDGNSGWMQAANVQVI